MKSINRRVVAADARKEQILHHAREQFVKHGFANASINEVSRLAGGSKATVAKYFTNKAGLFAAAMEEVNRQFIGSLTLPNAGAHSYEQSLISVGAAVLRFYLQPDALSIYRSVVAEGCRYPQMAEGFFRRCHMPLVRAVAAKLAGGETIDLEAAAERFVHLLRAGLYEQILLGVRPADASEEEIEEAARGAVAIFLHGIHLRRS
jgi:TetR/AcrR family transcriptional repressor of mexJK operon